MKEKFFCFGKNGFCDQSNDDVERCRKCKHYDGSGGDLRMQEKPPRLDREAWEPCKICGIRGMIESWILKREKFCAYCGHPLTDEAWQMLEERMGVETHENQ